MSSSDMTASPIRGALRAAVKSFLLTLEALTWAYFASPEETEKSLEKLRSFTPATMFSLVKDAAGLCKYRVWQDELQSDKTREIDVSPYSQGIEIHKNPLIVTRPPCDPHALLEGGDEWPTVGNWLAWADEHSIPRMPFVSAIIALADVAAHLAVAPSIPMKFLGLMQLLFGFATTSAVISVISRHLPNINEIVLVLLILLGTLFIGSAIAWVLLPVVSVMLASMGSVMHHKLFGYLISFATPLAGLGIIAHEILKWSTEKVKEKASEFVTDKVTAVLMRWIF